MRIADVLRNKGASVATITPETSVAGLLTELAVHNIGAMVVVSPDGLVGIVSERDVVRKLHELGGDLLTRPVSDIMTTLVATSAAAWETSGMRSRIGGEGMNCNQNSTPAAKKLPCISQMCTNSLLRARLNSA